MIQLNGTYQETIKRNEFSGWTLFSLKTNDLFPFRNRDGYVVCSGVIPPYGRNMPLKVFGSLNEEHKCLVIDNVKEGSSDKSVVIDFLISILDGIGIKQATAIVDIAGSDIFSFIQEEDALSRLSSLKRMTEEKAKEILSILREYGCGFSLISTLSKYEIPADAALRLFKACGPTADNQLIKSPYKLARTCDIPFTVIDKLAKDYGFSTFHEERLRALVLETLFRSRANGDCFASIKDIKKYADKITKNSAFKDKIPTLLLSNTAQGMDEVVIEKADTIRYWLKSDYFDELTIAKELRRINRASKRPFNPEDISKIEKELNIKYMPLQRAAFEMIATSGVKLLIGGPGTGKTTTINGIIKLYCKNNPDRSNVKLCAPTGRAAQRMKETSGMISQTIHKLAGIQPFMESVKDKVETIVADCIVLDEMSMTSASLFARFLKSVPDNCLVIMVGDADQLASVEPGNVLHDLISSGMIQTYHLNDNMRQIGQPTIIQNAYKINHKELNLVMDESFQIIDVDNEEDASSVVLSEYKKDKDNTQVLTPVHKDSCGTILLNRKLKDAVNPSSLEHSIQYGATTFSQNDKIIALKNHYDSDTPFFNGDMGIIFDVRENKDIATAFNGENLTISRDFIRDLSLAYAITIHKSQGSEYQKVIIVLPENAANISKNLIYTAVTRAKQKVLIINVNHSFESGILNGKNQMRKTGLSDRLRGIQYKKVGKETDAD